jgi:hypothetical protein
VHQRAPDREGRWVTSIFRATAYAIRRDVHLQIGGYTPKIAQFGEEWDLSLKMLDAGYVIRLGRADPIYHHASTKRNWRRMDIYERRHELLICWTYFPFPWSIVYMVGYALMGIARGFRVGRPRNMVDGVSEGLRLCAGSRGRRRPIGRSAFRFDQLARSRLRAGSGVRLAEAEAILGPLGPSAKPLAGGWPRPLRALHAPLRNARTKLVETFGRPVRCEVCGEVLFRALPLVARGRLKLLGAESTLVRADWDKMNRMTFRHLESDRCRPR